MVGSFSTRTLYYIPRRRDPRQRERKIKSGRRAHKRGSAGGSKIQVGRNEFQRGSTKFRVKIGSLNP